MLVGDLKTLRLQAGLSQVKLAHESGVSLPTIQNIEANKANLTMNVLEKLLETLGLEISFTPVPFSFERAIAFGVPLSGGTEVPLHRIDRQSLALEIRKWVHPLTKALLAERDELAVVSFLMAVKDHYPTLYAGAISSSTIEDKIKKYRKKGPALKLRRIALANLSHYL